MNKVINKNKLIFSILSACGLLGTSSGRDFQDASPAELRDHKLSPLY